MFGTVIGAIAGAVIGGTVRGVITSKANKEKVKAYKQASSDVRKATEQYSGKNAMRNMAQEGMDYAYDYGSGVGQEMSANTFVPQTPGATSGGVGSLAYQNAQNSSDIVKNATSQGYSQGAKNISDLMNAKYGAQTVGAEQAMKQADINYNVANQTAQEGLNAVGGVVQTAKDIGNPFKRKMGDSE